MPPATQEGMVIRWLILFLGIAFNASANILIKTGMAASSSGLQLATLWKIALQPALVAGVVCYGLALVCFSYSLTKFELSFAYPVMTSLALMIVSGYSVFVFRESMGGAKILGTLMILAGVVLLTRGGR